ncbi:MAG TPA: DUF4340 domain-containing protein [Gammaproteobacteria bacterium]|nr:DUF4340 domain-containing protein [Gammaproteobacteria bacterium]
MNPGKRSLYINLGLAAGLLLLGAVAWLAPPPRAANLKPFAYIDAERLSRIEISVPRQPPALLERHNGMWIVSDSPDVALDQQRLRNLLNLLNETVTQEYGIAGLDLKEFGLDTPAAILKLDDYEFRFGASEPVSRRRYVVHAGKLYLLPDTHYPLLSRGIGNLVLQPPATGNTTG